MVGWILSWATPLVAWPGAPPELGIAGRVGGVALAGLVGWWALTGFSGYEHFAGLRIIRRERGTGGVRWWLIGWAALAIAGLVALNLGHKNVFWVVGVAAGTFMTLLTLLTRRFSVFGTISIVGVVLGVAALIVVQSVATGFQHEFERRVLGVYAHINVTRMYGVSEYRRFEKYLRTVPDVVGASPFVYYAMALAPYNEAGDEGELRQASVLVKGIEPSTAAEVIDLPDHLGRGADGQLALRDLTSDAALEPVPDREDALLPPAIVDTPDPRGEGWYDRALKQYRSLPEGVKNRDPAKALGLERGEAPGAEDDEWEDGGEPAQGGRDAPAPAAEPEPPDEDDLAKVGTLDVGHLPTMYVGKTLARELGLEVGDVVSLVDPGATFDHSERPQYQYYRIVGVFQAGFQEYDTRLVYVDIRELQYFKYRGKDVVSGVDLRLTSADKAAGVARVLRETIGEDEYSILEWQKLNENLFQSIRTQKFIITIILSLVITVASFNVLSALWTIVVRRTPEIAILMSMGATESAVARIFQFTGMTIGMAGSLAGVLFGLVLCWLVELYGYTLDPDVYFIDRLPVEVSVGQIAAVLAMTLGICFLATIPPSLRAAKLRPVEGLRYE